MQLRLVIFVLTLCGLISSISTIDPPEPFSSQCKIGSKIEQHDSVPWFQVDLDEKAASRWKTVGTKYKLRMKELVQAIKIQITAFLGTSFVEWIDRNLQYIDNRLPPGFAAELRGMANVTEIPLSEIVLYNIFYEVFSVCTSIVAENERDGLYHARNMDFGLFLGWDRKSHDWLIAEKLRDLIINVNFVKNSKQIYKAVTFAGYVGVFTAMKPQAYAVTNNERFKLDGGYLGLLQWLIGASNASWVSWMIRDLFENNNDYSAAVRTLSTTPVIAPFYGVISGIKRGEGQIIVRSRNSVDGVVKLNPNGQRDNHDEWFLLQTNTDPWKNSFFLDDRRSSGRTCMQKLGRQNLSLNTLLQVLSSPITLNKLTVFSTVIKTDQDLFHTYVQKCADPCWPW